jgi:Tfp pilus assembly protein PilF
MNIKNLGYLFLTLNIITFLGCQKKAEKNTALASNYYKLSILELEDDEEFEQAAKRSINYLDEAIKHDPKGSYLATKATLLFRLCNFEQAKQLFKKSLKSVLSPKLKCEVLNNYACLLAQIGEIDAAMKIFCALEKDKDYLTPEVALFNQAKIFTTQKKYRLAKGKLMDAVRLAPDYLDSHFYLAIVSGYYLKDITLAKKEVQAVLYLEPAHKGALGLEKYLNSSG